MFSDFQIYLFPINFEKYLHCVIVIFRGGGFPFNTLSEKCSDSFLNLFVQLEKKIP